MKFMTMAQKIQRRSSVQSAGGFNRAFAAISDAAVSPSTKSRSGFKKMAMSAAFAPVWMVLGMVVVATSIGMHTAKQQLCHSPSVQLTKKKRECVPEVEIPDAVAVSGNKFISKSFLRKVAHIQDDKRTINQPALPDPFTRSRDIEAFKSGGSAK